MSHSRKAALARMVEAAAAPVTIVVARAGAGKSFALGAHLEGCSETVIRFDVAAAHGSLTRFVRGFSAALETVLPRVAQSLAIAHEKAMQSPQPADVLAAWLAEHLGEGRYTIAIDELHHCEGERAIATFLASAVERTRGRVRWIFVTRSSADLPLATWLARGDADLPIDDRVLQLTHDEARELAASIAPELDAATVARLCDATNGNAAIFTFAAQTVAQDPRSAERLLSAGGGTFERFADETFGRLTPAERDVLLETCALPEVDESLLLPAGLHAAAATLDAIEAKAPQLFERRRGSRAYRSLFRTYLSERAADVEPVPGRSATMRAADALESAGRIGDSLAYRLRERNDAELVRAIETHGFSMLESGYGESLQEAIDALDPLLQMSSPVTLAIKAMAESRLGRFDTAESWFQLAIDRAPAPLRGQISYQYGNHLVRFLRREAVDVLERVAAEHAADEELRGYALSALGPAFVFQRRPDAARESTDAALAIAERLGRPHLLAKVHHQAAFVALFAGDARRAKSLAQAGLARAEAGGYFDIAAGALTVLCNVASDIEDDPAESLRLLESVGDCAAKSGCLYHQIFALVSMIEIQMETGDEAGAARTDEKLRTLDVTCGARALYEALLPTQALRAAWSGDFAGGYNLLAKSADQPWSADRKALRLAEIAMYAAAASLGREAADAVRRARAALEGIADVDLRVQRARLILALALTLLGRSEEAERYFDLIDASPEALSERLRALRRTLGALLERFRGARNQNDLLANFVELDARGFGGLARALMALPLRDNATRRIGRLTVAERMAMLRYAEGDEGAAEPHLRSVMRKLGVFDAAAVLRAVTWHRDLFEIPASEAFGISEEACDVAS